MRNKVAGGILCAAMITSLLSGCNSSIVDQATTTKETAETVQQTETEAADKTDLSETVPLKFNIANGNKSRTMTYNQESPLTLPDGTVVTAGMLKPMWTYVEKELNSKFSDVTIQDVKSKDMIQTESTSNFSGANIYGGESIAERLMFYGTEGKFVNLTEKMEAGYMPNFKEYLEKNPDVKAAVTAYDGSIYHVPYIAELNQIARTFVIRESWVTGLLDAEGAAYDQKPYDVHYNGFYVEGNRRVGENGGTVTPKIGIDIVKKTDQSIIEIQNALDVKNGETLTKALIQYIADNYDYEHPSELFLGEAAAYDIDEMIALMRCIKANPALLTEGKAEAVWPLFVRQSTYREDLLRLSTYFDGIKVHGADSYQARWYIDKNGDVQYTYAEEGVYKVLQYLSMMEAEGLIYSDAYDLNEKTNYRSTLWGTDTGEAPSFGFMTYDWIASSTADSLNPDTVVILPPVAKVNGAWQYFLDNGRAIKPDGWAISVAGSTEAEVERACAVMDYFFTEEGSVLQNYGLPMNLEAGKTYEGPDGIQYPLFTPWVYETSNNVAKGDLSTFLRDWMGCLMPIGYQKEIGFEYQYTSERGFDGWALLQNSTTNFATYAGKGIAGDNPNYYKMVPPVFSLTSRQKETVSDTTSLDTDDIVEYMFNIVRYQAKGNAPQGAEVAGSYEDYLAKFNERGLGIYEETYQAAYEVMTADK
ncbi:MAG: hypothetical protein QM657_13630 [Lacrimispora sp.]|uniref:hypothetical protein n=1 Tax=Lacrimispora sp. TaxID=2719234 RepID=UPI0039E57590